MHMPSVAVKHIQRGRLMLRYVLFDLSLFNDGDDRALDEEGLCWLLEALTQWNQIYLKRHPETPKLYKSGVRYKTPEQFAQAAVPQVEVIRGALERARVRDRYAQEALDDVARMCGGGEHFRDIPRIIENGGGDCFPLSQRIIVRSQSTGMYELLSLGELRFAYSAYEALSYNFSACEYEFKPIVGFVDKGMKPVSIARLSNGTDLVATDDHKFWTLNGSKQYPPYPDSFKLGVRTMGEYVNVYDDYEKGRLSKGQRTTRSRIIQAARIPALGVVRPSSAEAYLTGIYAAEGNFDGKHTCIAQHKSAVRKKIEGALAEVDTAFRYRSGHGRTPGSGAYYALHGGLANPIVAMMRGQGRDSFDKRLPQSFLSGDAVAVAHVLEGHADGDAWRPATGTYKRPGVEAIYATSSGALMEQLRFGMLMLGRPFYAYQYADHQGEGSRPIWRLHEYNDSASKLRSREELLKDDLPGLRYGTVRNARPAGTAHVGCIEVEGNHNFFLADGTLAANCDNVCAWRAAELRQSGIHAMPYITHRQRQDGGTTYHAIVRWPDGSSEDPSLLLGMGGPDREMDRAEERRKNAERHDKVKKAMRAAHVLGLTRAGARR